MAFGAPHGATVVQFRKGLEIHAQQRRARPFAAQMEMAVSTASWGVEFRDKRGIMGAGGQKAHAKLCSRSCNPTEERYGSPTRSIS